MFNIPLENIAFSRRRHHYWFKGCKILAVVRHLRHLSSDHYRLRAAKCWQFIGTSLWPLSSDHYRWRAAKFWQLFGTYEFEQLHLSVKGCRILAVARHLWPLSSDHYRWRAAKFWQFIGTSLWTLSRDHYRWRAAKF